MYIYNVCIYIYNSLVCIIWLSIEQDWIHSWYYDLLRCALPSTPAYLNKAFITVDCSFPSNLFLTPLFSLILFFVRWICLYPSLFISHSDSLISSSSFFSTSYTLTCYTTATSQGQPIYHYFQVDGYLSLQYVSSLFSAPSLVTLTEITFLLSCSFSYVLVPLLVPHLLMVPFSTAITNQWATVSSNYI